MGSSDRTRLDIEARVDNLDEVTDFVSDVISSLKYSENELAQIRIITEELFVNIASYAYSGPGGMASVTASVDEKENSVELTFVDSGIKYNPIFAKEPDITLPLRQRKKGGLGIFFVKKKVDELSYCYRNGNNILTLRKIFRGA